MAELRYEFQGRDDAARYLREVAVVWTVWIVGLIGILFTTSYVIVVWAVVLFAVLFLVARPIQARSIRVVPENAVEGGALNTALRGGTTRDRALRELLYGTAPLRVALAELGLNPRWVSMRHLVVTLTILAMVYIVFGAGS